MNEEIWKDLPLIIKIFYAASVIIGLVFGKGVVIAFLKWLEKRASRMREEVRADLISEKQKLEHRVDKLEQILKEKEAVILKLSVEKASLEERLKKN